MGITSRCAGDCGVTTQTEVDERATRIGVQTSAEISADIVTTQIKYVGEATQAQLEQSVADVTQAQPSQPVITALAVKYGTKKALETVHGFASQAAAVVQAVMMTYKKREIKIGHSRAERGLCDSFSSRRVRRSG